MRKNLKSFIALLVSTLVFTGCEQGLNLEPNKKSETATSLLAEENKIIANDDMLMVDYGAVVGYKFTLSQYISEYSPNKVFFSAFYGKKYSMKSVATTKIFNKIDFFFYYYDGVHPKLMAPIALPSKFSDGVFDQTGAVNNKTAFSTTKLTVKDLSKAVKDPAFIKANFDPITDFISTSVIKNTIYAFKIEKTENSGDRYGLIRVLNVTKEGITLEVFVNEKY